MRKTIAIFFTSAPFSLFAQCYNVSQIAYSSDTSRSPHAFLQSQTQADDQFSPAIPIGFTFCFYGQQYDSLIIGTNGVVSFQTSLASGYCIWPIQTPIPSPGNPTSSILGPWADLRYDSSHMIYYWSSGTAPNRIFTVKFDSLTMYTCANNYVSSRIILRETSNEIEIQIDNKDACQTWNAGRAIIGIQNQSGTSAVAAPGRNAPTAWTATQEAWMFTPTCNVCSGVGISETSDVAAPITIYPNPTDGSCIIQLPEPYPTISSIEIIDVTGRVVESSVVNLTGGQQMQISIENSGMYFLRLYDENNMMISSEKLIVE